ncbi:MAG: MFS transporter [Thermoanaerobaculia bacterium]|nr:MFS transporter [Thermoanaerobaculia bacterium]
MRPARSESGGLELSRLWVLMVTAFVDMIGFALVMPLLPFYALRFGADASTIGFLMSSFAFGQLVTAPLWGRLSDRIGRRPVIITAQAIAAGAFLIFAFAGSVWLLFVCRILQGVGAGSLGTVSAFVSDVVEPRRRAEALGWITACTSAGVMVGPAIGSLTVGLSQAAPGVIAASMSLLNMIFAFYWLHEPKTPTQGQEKTRRAPIRGQLLEVIGHPLRRVHSLIWIYTAGMMAFMAMTGVMALYLEEVFGITERNIGWFYVAVGAVSVVMRGLILGKLVNRLGEVRVLRLGALSLGLGMIGVTLAAGPWLFAFALLLVPTGTALLFPCTTSLVTRYARKDQVGQTVGVQQAFGGMSRLLAPIWAGLVFESVGVREPFWIGGALVLLTALVALRLAPGEASPADGASSEGTESEISATA